MTAFAGLLTAADLQHPTPAAVRPLDPAQTFARELALHQPALRQLVHRLLAWPGNAHEVDDVVQDALLAAWARRATFRGDAALRTWLTRIALRKARNHVRWRHLRQRLLRPFDPESVVASAPADDPRAARLRTELQALPHRDREVLVLRYLEEREIPAIAELLGLGRAAVDARLSRARARLRTRLELDGGAS